MNVLPHKKSIRLVTAISLYFLVLTPLPATASVIESCVEDQCTVTFSYSGQMQTFTPPANAKNMTFDAFGAQGGRSGGSGGRVTGSFITIPEVLFLFVGGVGATGPSAAGGFNGGGAAGSGLDLPGSGGGATDIRTGLELSSRIAIAGGGGGRGAGLGSGGGSGGGLIALDGRTAQGMGGAGGSQLAGGTGGLANGTGSPGEQGNLGIGGSAGGSTLLGGGGGGGGYFGGGGGGSDTDPCCSGAGGGGGGSSYTDTSIISKSTMTQGARIGSGQLIIRYQLAPMVLGIASSSSGSQASFEIEFSGAVSGFEISDLEISHSSTGCESASLEGSGSSYQLLLSGCEDGELSIAINPNSVSNTLLFGPEEKFLSNSFFIDTMAPLAFFGEVSSAGSVLEFSEPIHNLDVSAIQFTADLDSCTLLTTTQESDTSWRVITFGCDQSNFTLSLSELSVSDSTGNLGPVAVVSTSFNFENPEPPTETAEQETSQESIAEVTQEPAQSVEPARPDLPTDEPMQLENPKVDEPIDLPAKKSNLKKQTASTQNLLQVEPELDQDSSEEAIPPIIFVSPPAASLPQASQTVTIPAQDFVPGFSGNYWVPGLVATGVFALLAGLIVARREIPGVVIS
jgi:hypothetical protein